MRLIQYLTAVVVFAATAANALAADETYAIKLSRPSKVGDIYDVNITFDWTQTTTATEPQTRPYSEQESVKGNLAGRVEVLKVDQNGTEVSTVITLQKFVDGNGKDLAKTAQKLQVTREGMAAFTATLDGRPPPLDTTKVLNFLYGSQFANLGNDELLGTSDMHKVGDSWPARLEVLAKNIAASGMKFDVAKSDGTTTLKSAETLRGIPVLRITSALNVRNSTKPIDAPMKLDSWDTHIIVNSVFPVDPSLPPLEHEVSITFDMHATNPETGVVVTTKVTTTKNIKITPVAK